MKILFQQVFHTAMHQGNILREFLKELPDLSMGEIAKVLEMTPQNLNHHLRKEALEGGFLRLLKEKMGVVFKENTFSKLKPSSASNAILLEENDYHIMMVPLVNKYAYAGYQAGFGDDEYVESLPRVPMMVNKEHKGKYLAFEIKGDSMNNGEVGNYEEGYTVFGREIPRHHWRDKLHYKKWPAFIIVTKRDGILVKQITKHDAEKGIITLHSWNEEYQDTEMHLDNVAQLLNVVDAKFK